MLGIIVDTSTPGISDQVVSNSTVQAINSSNTQVSSNVQVSSNISTTDNSASSKIIVDNPDNVQAIDQEVNAISATAPSAN
jgi:hypothetical protein